MENRIDSETYVEFKSSYMGVSDYIVYPKNAHSYRVHVRYAPVDDYERSIRAPGYKPERERSVGEYWPKAPAKVVDWIERYSGRKLHYVD
jgi:hypothetical protein